ncbi:AMP-binding protein [Insolitispirillum peregrinum]|uniref:AMP-binding protein n=1 Tax=Insolitispirillum peregrinum TaxID=80876 RepID=UPI0036113864
MRNVVSAIRGCDPRRVALSDQSGQWSYGELVQAIARRAAAWRVLPPVVGVLMPRDRRAVAAELALASLGRTVVPLPDFFSPAQWQHMVADAGIAVVVTVAEWQDRLTGIAVPTVLYPAADDGSTLTVAEPSRRIIYTSGTSGQPKGVVLDEGQMAASLAGLKVAARARPDDVHLSLLPFSLLLEHLCGVLLPLSVGARVHIAQSPLEAEAVQATTAVVVPALLRDWVAGLQVARRQAPASLRLVAVGGAPVAEALAEQAWACGLPVHEGYGLSECCSVVAVNRPGARRAGTVGKPLAGVTVEIEDGEIVVSGPTVMAGYLGRAPAGGRWHTGDLGSLDDDGYLRVLGRKDAVIVTAQGRNISPDWIEAGMLTDPLIRCAALLAGTGGDSGTQALIVPHPQAGEQDWDARVAATVRDFPAYARPQRVTVIPADLARQYALFTLDGRPRRAALMRFIEEKPMSFYQHLLLDTASEREQFQRIPLIAQAVRSGVSRALYLAFLGHAYHHVRYTVPLLQTALQACGPQDAVLAAGLQEYIAEETGHEDWILDDIRALGGDAEACRSGRPALAVRVLVAHAFHLIAEDGPYALLGMVHVLEGMSVALAVQAAGAIRHSLGAEGEGGFSYLSSHGALDQDHVAGFARLLDAVDQPGRRQTVIAAAREFYTLYGNVFRSLEEMADAA